MLLVTSLFLKQKIPLWNPSFTASSLISNVSLWNCKRSLQVDLIFHRNFSKCRGHLKVATTKGLRQRSNSRYFSLRKDYRLNLSSEKKPDLQLVFHVIFWQTSAKAEIESDPKRFAADVCCCERGSPPVVYIYISYTYVPTVSE